MATELLAFPVIGSVFGTARALQNMIRMDTGISKDRSTSQSIDKDQYSALWQLRILRTDPTRMLSSTDSTHVLFLLVASITCVATVRFHRPNLYFDCQTPKNRRNNPSWQPFLTHLSINLYSELNNLGVP